MGNLAGDRKAANDPALQIGYTFTEENSSPTRAQLDALTRKFTVINEAAAQLVGVEDEQSIFQLVLNTARMLLPDASLITGVLDADGKAMRVVGQHGLDRYVESIGRMLGEDPLQMAFPLADATEALLALYRRGKLHHFEDGFYSFSIRSVPPLICKAIEKLLDLGEVWAIGIAGGGQHYGALGILLPRNQTIDDAAPIETIVNQAAIAIRRVRAEEALRSSETKLRTVFQMLPVGISIRDKDGFVIDQNPALLSITGLSDQVFQNPASTYLPCVRSDGSPMPEHELPSVRAQRERRVITDVELGFVKADGATVWTSVSAAPLPIEGLSVAVVTTDITARKKAEAERLRLEQQIQQTQRLESLGILAGGIAHDFNNLLGGLYGYIDLAAVSCGEQTVKQHLIQAMASMGRARSLTQQLLTFAKGGAPLRKPSALIPFVKDTVQFALSGSAIGCRYDLPGDLWPCDIDANQIAQVIDNIVINAQHAMPEGGQLSITARNRQIGKSEFPLLKAGKYVEIALRDTGRGIAREILPRIFDPFFTTKQKGSGLGLATAYAIVKRHDGHIDVESNAGAGSTFRIFLPACPAAVCAINPPAPAQPGKAAGRILIMDDEEVIRNIVRIILTDEGYGVTCVREGQEAVRILTEEAAAGRPFSAVILDLTIAGGMGGKQALAEIRKRHATIPVFVASGYASDPIMANPRDHGFTDGLSKPFSITELTGMLRRHLSGEAR
jgi:PAS domain S-box-containing protein